MKRKKYFSCEKKIKEILKQMLKYKKSTKQIKNNLFSDVINLINKESLIIQLKNENKFMLKLNFYYKNYLDSIIKLKLQIKKEHDEVEKLYLYLKKNFTENVNIIENYDKKIHFLNTNKKEIENNYEKKIHDCLENNKKLEIKLKEINEKNNLLKIDLDNIIIKKNNIINKKENELKQFLKNEKIQQKKYNQLNKNYLILINQENYINNLIKETNLNQQNNIKIINNNNNFLYQTIINNNNNKENKNIQLNELKLKYENLLRKYKKIKNNIQKIENNYKNENKYLKYNYSDNKFELNKKNYKNSRNNFIFEYKTKSFSFNSII